MSIFSDDKKSNSSWNISRNLKPKDNDINNWVGIKKYLNIERVDKLSVILPILRNALAHGRIFTEGDKMILTNISYCSTQKAKDGTLYRNSIT
ncbi:conserved hypothetical protein (plasmid) ['Nostoc azollae' 0708]|jgi:hypothetical protein|uniref:Uncharacterized protein n=1 Tax=Nostoc azollae (strain 0708) TaxID=551115 RepID=D7E5M3_NOSA0|nr:conserved hypothetical protein ['Nostoc azollae' 0708]